MWRMYVRIRAELEHWRRLLRYVEGQPSRLFPSGNRLDERSGREFAKANGADSLTADLRSLRTGNAQAKIPGSRGWQLGKCDDVWPDDFRRRIDLDRS